MPWLNALLTHAPESLLDLLRVTGHENLDDAASLLARLTPDDQDRLVRGVSSNALTRWCAEWWGLVNGPGHEPQALAWCALPLNAGWSQARQASRSVEWLWSHRPLAGHTPSPAWNAWWSLGEEPRMTALLTERRFRWKDETTGWNNGISWIASPLEIATLTGDLGLMETLHQHGVPLFTAQKHPDDTSPLLLAVWRAQQTGDGAPMAWLLDHGARWDQGWSLARKNTRAITAPLVSWHDGAWAAGPERDRAHQQGTPWDLALRQDGPAKDLAVQAFFQMSTAERRRCQTLSVYQDGPRWAMVEALVLRASMGAVSAEPYRRPRL